MRTEVTLDRRTRLLWLAGALALGFASQWCLVFGVCAAPGL